MAYYNKNNTNQPSAEDRALDRFAEMMIDKISTLQENWQKPWFTEGTMKWPKNLSGREYNGMNALMLMMHCENEGYKIPVFMTFDRITGLNYNKDKEGKKISVTNKDGEKMPQVSVLKGAKSFPVFITTFTVVDKETREKIKYEDYKNLSDEEKERYNVYPKLNVYNVFNVDQTNIKEARPELYQKLEKENTIEKPEVKQGEMFSFPAVDKMIKDNLWICPIKPTHGDQAFFTISKNEIVVPEKKQFKDGESFYGTTFHEMAHSTGTEAHLNRIKPSAFGSAEYAREELVAELTAALVAQRYGITKNLKEDSACYLKSWLSSLKESPDFIKTTLTDVKKASSLISQKIDPLMLEIEKNQQVENEATQEKTGKIEESLGKAEAMPEVKGATVLDVPQWSLPYLLNGDVDGMSDEEQQIVDEFVSKNFPHGFTLEILSGTTKEFNSYPAFGERNENALTSRGEAPYLAVDTISVAFHALGQKETVSETISEENESVNELKELTVSYAVEHITGEGMHTGISWLSDSYNELCEELANNQGKDIEEMTHEELLEHRNTVAQMIVKESYLKLNDQQFESLVGIMDELSQETELQRTAGVGR